MAEHMNTSFYKSAYKDQCKGDKVNPADFVARAGRLKMQQDYLDKAQAIAIKRMKCLDHHAAQDLSASYKQMESQRFHECKRLHHSLFSISQSLKQLRDNVGNEDKLKQLEIEHYQKSVFELEDKIRTFIEANNKRFQKLLEEELALSSDLKNLENKYDDWSQAVDPSLLKPPVRSISKSYISNTDNTREEVSTFQRFLQHTGGHRGSWNEDDHLLFLHLRNKHKGKTTFLSVLQQHLPGISADDILLHENWYQRYEILKAKQKQAIQEWRALRDKSSQQNGTNSESVQLHQRSKVENCEESAEKKQKIEAWKKILQLKKELEEKKQREDKQKELEREQKRRERQALKKVEVECYKQEKLNEQQTKMLAKQLKELRELEERAAQANILCKAFREQDELFVACQVSRRKQRTLKEEERKKQLRAQKQEVSVGRDPERLLRPTAAWHERCKQKDKTNIVSRAVPVLHLRNMPHLQVPSWRRGLT